MPQVNEVSWTNIMLFVMIFLLFLITKIFFILFKFKNKCEISFLYYYCFLI